MGSLDVETSVPAAKAVLDLPAHYLNLKTDAKRMIDTLEESCTWGSTPDGGMSMCAQKRFMT